MLREVHISGGFEQEEGLIFHAYGGDKTVTAVFPRSTRIFSNAVYHVETDVVARVGIFGTDVAEPDNEINHGENKMFW